MNSNQNQKWIIIAFLVIPIFILLSLTYVPIFSVIMFSFTNWKGFGSFDFIGFSNYKTIFTNPQYFIMFRNCLYYLLMAIPQITLALTLAIIVNSKVKGDSFFRAVLYFPSLLNSVVVGVIFLTFYQTSGGTFNNILDFVGLGFLKQDWLGNPTIVNPAIAAIGVWKYFGFNFLMFISAISTISPSQFEAAQIDGASRFDEIKDIILPSIKRTIMISIILAISGSIQVFELPYIMLKGSNGTMTPLMQINNIAFLDNRIGLAAALSIIVLFVVAISVGLQQ
ncbi:MAG: carbohydrate ABC transporter permease, partial [Bacilli bacterium]